MLVIIPIYHDRKWFAPSTETPCGARLDERLVRAASKSLKRKRAITPPPTDPTPSSPPYSPASDSGPVPDLPELHAFPHADIDPSAAPPPPKKTRVEDVEDDDDVDKPREYYIEDFPWPAGDPIIDRGVLPPFFELFRHEKVEKKEEMWAPFSSREEWELARWLMRSFLNVSVTKSYDRLH